MADRENGAPGRTDAPVQRGDEEPTELGPLPALVRSGLGRIVLAAVAVVVIVAVIVGVRSDELRIAVGIVLIPVLVYLTIASNRDRRADDRARRYYDRHGRWPNGRSGRSG